MVDRYRNYQPKRATRQRPKKNRARRFTVLFLLLLALFFAGKMLFKSKPSESEPAEHQNAEQQQPEKKVEAETISSTTWQDLESAMTALLQQHDGLDIAVGLVDINSGTTASYGIKESFHGASTTKVLTAAAYLHDVETGKRTLTEPLSGAPAETHLKRMINRSDNTSWEVLNQAVGYTRLNSYAQANGISSYKYIGNLMSASDEASLLAKLYSRKLLNEQHTSLLLSFMQNTNNETMIPLAIPGGTLYHKYGQLEDRLHDAAILDYRQQPIAIVIYTKGTSDGNVYSVRTALIQQIAKEVFAIIYR